MSPVEREVEIYQCPSCGHIGQDRETMCCGNRMEPFETTIFFEPPELEEIARQVFGASPTELEICDVLIAEGEATASELSELVSRNRTTTSRHLNHLVERGLVTKRSEVIKEGGQIKVYSCVPPAKMRRKLETGFSMWAQEAMSKIDERMQAKTEAAGQSDRMTASGSNTKESTNTPEPEANSEAESKTAPQRDSLMDRLLDSDMLS